jgi:hypothetical protein
MLRKWTARLLLVTAMAGGAAACDDETPTTPTPPSTIVTETFTGNISQNGAQTHSFSTASSGTVTARLREVSPDSALVVGFSLGNWNATSSTCQILLANDAATAGAVHSGTMTGIGTLCVRVYDVGNVSATPAAYIVEVEHP